MGHSCRTLLWDTLVGHSSYETSSKSHTSILQNERFVRDFLQKSHVKSPKRAFRTRLPPKVTCQVSKTSMSKTSVSYDTSSKSHVSSLQNEHVQNERFVRDFLQKSHVKSPKRAFRTRLQPPKVTCQVSKTSMSYETSSKSQAETPIGAHTSRSPAKQFRESSPSKQHPFTRQSHCDSDIHLYHNSHPHNSLRLPRIFPHPHV